MILYYKFVLMKNKTEYLPLFNLLSISTKVKKEEESSSTIFQGFLTLSPTHIFKRGWLKKKTGAC